MNERVVRSFSFSKIKKKKELRNKKLDPVSSYNVKFIGYAKCTTSTSLFGRNGGQALTLQQKTLSNKSKSAKNKPEFFFYNAENIGNDDDCRNNFDDDYGDVQIMSR